MISWLLRYLYAHFSKVLEKNCGFATNNKCFCHDKVIKPNKLNNSNLTFKCGFINCYINYTYNLRNITNGKSNRNF